MAEEPQLDLVQELRSIASLLDRERIPYAICGGIAVTIHGAARSTMDIDLLVLEEDLERIVDEVRPLGWRFRALPMVFDADRPEARHLTRITRVQGRIVLMLGLITVTGWFEDIWATRERIEIGDQSLSVVSREGLAKMKRLAGRPQDIADLEKLGLEP